MTQHQQQHSASSGSSSSSRHYHHDVDVKADAEFLQRCSNNNSNNNTSAAAAAMASATSSNLLNLQVVELLNECGVGGAATTTTTTTASELWWKQADAYQHAVADVLHAMPAAALLPPPPQRQKPGPEKTGTGTRQAAAATATPRNAALRVILQQQPSSSSSSSSTGSLSSLLLLNATANANVLPTLTLTVLLPTGLLQCAPNDCKKGRYFEKRNAAVAQVAKYLTTTTTEHNDAGLLPLTVYGRLYRGDPRKASLVLVPTTTTARTTRTAKATTSNSSSSSSSKKRNTDNSDTLAVLPKRLRFRLQLNFAMDNIDWIPPLRLVPNRCNVSSGTGGGNGSFSSSVHYNHSLTEDALHTLDDMRMNYSSSDHGDAAAATTEVSASVIVGITSNNNFGAAAALICIWCLQRGLLRGHDTLDETTVHVLLLYLFRTKLVNGRMTAVQVVTAFFKLLAETVWLNDSESDGGDDDDGAVNTNASNKGGKSASLRRKSVLVMPAPGKTVPQTVAASEIAQLYATTTRENTSSNGTSSDPPPPTLLELYQQQRRCASETPVLLDSSMRHNYLFRVSPASIRTLARQAAASLQCLHHQHHSTGSGGAAAAAAANKPFQQMFMTEARFWTRHDAYLRIPLPDISTTTIDSDVGGANKNKNSTLWGNDRADVGDYESLARGLVHVLRRALGDRVLDLQLLSTGNGDPAKKSSSSVVADSDEIPTLPVDHKKPLLPLSKKKLQSPTGSNYAVLGVTVNPDTCYRVVDRGPPNEQTVALQHFLELWGAKAELRRFKDGAIVHAVVWDQTSEPDASYTQFQNDDTWQGGIVERIIRHVLKLHFLKSDAAVPQFSLRDIVSTVDGVASKTPTLFTNPLAAHRTVMKAFEALTDLLRKKSALSIQVPGSATEMKSALGIPLAIDAIEPLSPALRYAALYPPIPHPLLGASPVAGQKKASGAVQSDPLEIQIRFGASSKWPNDLKAIGAAKTAMLIELVKGIELLKKSGTDGELFEGSMIVTPSYADICFMGYVFRVFVRADPELKLLRGLQKPSPEAALLLQTLTRKTVVAATHHSMVHAVYTSHPSSSATVRIARRWLSTHLLSDQIPFEALELMVAHVYTNRSSPMEAPGTATAGFLRLLHLLATHDWAREPLIVDPQGHLNDMDHNAINSQFDKARGQSHHYGPALYIVSPCNHAYDDESTSTVARKGENEKSWYPSFTTAYPERVVLSRAVALAERTHAFLRKSLVGFDGNAWPGSFQESTESFRSYSALLRVDPAFIVNADASSSGHLRSLLVCKNKFDELETTYTRSMRSLAEGPKELRRKLYRNLMGDEDSVLLEWRPIQATVQAMRAKLGGLALVFYNDLCPDVLAVVWRPLFQPRSFSAVTSEYVRPVSEDWQSDTMMTLNVNDVLREMVCLTSDIVINIKVFDHGPQIEPSTRGKRKHSEAVENEQDSGDDSESSQSV